MALVVLILMNRSIKISMKISLKRNVQRHIGLEMVTVTLKITIRNVIGMMVTVAAQTHIIVLNVAPL